MRNNIAIKKLIEFLEYKMNDIAQTLNMSFSSDLKIEDIEKELEEDESYKSIVHEYGFMDRLVSLLSNIDDPHYKDDVITDDFKDLSDCLVESPLKKNERFDIVMMLIKRNIDNNLTTDDRNILILDGPMLSKSGISLEILDKLVKKNKLNTIMNEMSEEELTAEEKEIKEKIFSIAKDTDLSIGEKYAKNHKILEQLYFNNIDGYDSEDIKSIILALKNISISDEICDDIEYILNRNLTRRVKKQKREVTVHFSDSNKKESKKYISDKEYKEIKKELKKYIDLYTMMPTRDLSEEEVMYCANLLLKIGTEENLVKTLFFRSEKTANIKGNPIGTYNKIYDKLKFYEDGLLLQESMAVVNDYIREVFISTDDDYYFWKEQIAFELTNIINMLPKSYKYEIEKAKTYSKK